MTNLLAAANSDMDAVLAFDHAKDWAIKNKGKIVSVMPSLPSPSC